MGKLYTQISNDIKNENGALLYRVCRREIIVYQYKEVKDAYLADKIYLKHDLIRVTRRKNKTKIVKNPASLCIEDALNKIEKHEYNYIDSQSMSKLEMIIFIEFNNNVKISHWLFGSNEYIMYDGCKVVDENNYLFEDWFSDGLGRHDGIRQRDDANWLNGWYVKKVD